MTALPVTQHTILACIAEIAAALDTVVDEQPVYLSTSEKGAALRELTALAARVSALRLRVMAAADDVAEVEGARDIAAWVSHATLAEPDVTRAEQRLAHSLDRDRPRVAQALAAGICSMAQAHVIVRSLGEL